MKRIAIFAVLALWPATSWAQMAPAPMARPAASVVAPKPATMTVAEPAKSPVMVAPAAMKAAPMAVKAPKPAAKALSEPTPTMGTPAPKAAQKLSPAPQKKSKGEKDPWWKALLAFLSKLGLSLAGALLPVLVAYGTAWVRAKLKLEKAEGMERMLDAWTDKGISYAEQQASKLDDNPDENAAKMKLATDFVLKLVEANGLPKKVAGLVGDRIESRMKAAKKDG